MKLPALLWAWFYVPFNFRESFASLFPQTNPVWAAVFMNQQARIALSFLSFLSIFSTFLSLRFGQGGGPANTPGVSACQGWRSMPSPAAQALFVSAQLAQLHPPAMRCTSKLLEAASRKLNAQRWLCGLECGNDGTAGGVYLACWILHPAATQALDLPTHRKFDVASQLLRSWNPWYVTVCELAA